MDPLRSVDKSLLPVESVEPSKEIFLDGDPEADELIRGSTFYKKGSTFLRKAQVASHNTGMRGDRRSKREKPLTNGMLRAVNRARRSEGTILHRRAFIVILVDAGTTGLSLLPVQHFILGYCLPCSHSRGQVRLILTLPLLLSVTLACLSDCVVVIGFSLNRSYIATNLCEKKDVPGNTCRGCCLLRKALQNEDRKAQSPPVRNLREFDDFQPVPANSPTTIRSPRTGKLSFASFSFSIPFPPGRDIDHPPEISSL